VLSRQCFLIEASPKTVVVFGLNACRQLKVPLYLLWIGLDVHPIYWSDALAND